VEPISRLLKGHGRQAFESLTGCLWFFWTDGTRSGGNCFSARLWSGEWAPASY